MKNLTKKMGVAIAVLGIASTATVASVRYSLSEFENPSSMSSFGIVQAGGRTFLKGSIPLNINQGPLELGLDVNAYAPVSNGSYYPADLQWVTLRSVGYTHGNVAGIKYGRLSGVTYGYGLLMDDYDSGLGGDSSEFSWRKGGVKGWLNAFGARIDALETGGNLIAGRISYEIPEVTLAGTPIILGATTVSDQDGINDPVNTGTVTRAAVKGYAGDIGLPFAGDFLTGYFEYAAIADHAQGYGTGIKGDFFDVFKYRFEYRSLNSGFVPGYFNSTYEATSFDFGTDAPQNSITGFLGAVSFAIPSLPFRAALQTESYTDRSLLTAALGWTNIANTTGVINYTFPFQNAANPIMDSSILYKTGGLFDYVLNVKRVYYSSSSFTESYDIGIRFNPSKLLPGIF